MMQKFMTFLAVLVTVISVFLTSALGVFFFHSYRNALEKQDLNDEIYQANLQHSQYTQLLEGKTSHPIDKKDFFDADSDIFSLAQKNELTALDVSEEGHILKENPEDYTCQLTLVGPMRNIKSFLRQFTELSTLVNITEIKIEPYEDEYLAKIKYTIYFTPEEDK